MSDDKGVKPIVDALHHSLLLETMSNIYFNGFEGDRYDYKQFTNNCTHHFC